MAQMGKADVNESIQSFQVTQSLERRIGEDLIVEKINKIFDEVAKDRQDFESGYVDLSKSMPAKRKNQDQSAQVHDASLLIHTDARADAAPTPNTQVPMP